MVGIGFADAQYTPVREKRGCGGAIIPRFFKAGIHGLPHVVTAV
jgi:hypothetical protein